MADVGFLVGILETGLRGERELHGDYGESRDNGITNVFDPVSPVTPVPSV